MKILAVGLLMAIAAGAASTGQNELAGNANTPEQHRRLAESYRADSQQLMEEAQAYYTRYAVTMADHDAVDAHMAGKKEFSQSHDLHAYDRYRRDGHEADVYTQQQGETPP